MATLYLRIPDPLMERINDEAKERGLTLTAIGIVLLERALAAVDRERVTRDNRGGRYPDA